MVTLIEKQEMLEAHLLMGDLISLTINNTDEFRVRYNIVEDMLRLAITNHVEPVDLMVDAMDRMEKSSYLASALDNSEMEKLRGDNIKLERNMNGYAIKAKSLQARVDKANRIFKREGVDKV